MSTEIDLPPESKILDAAYRTSGLTAADLAAATGLSVGSIRIALSGIRYRNGEGKAVAPADPTLAKLASVLGVSPAALREVGRDRAAELMLEAADTVALADLDTKAAIAGRAALARQVLGVFSTDELRAEIARRGAGE